MMKHDALDSNVNDCCCDFAGLAAPAIVSDSIIDVVVDPPGPFALFPDALLQAVGNAGLHASLSTLQVCRSLRSC